jgi:hypothetical protein
LKRIGVGVAGAELDKNLRELYRELDVDNSAGSDGIDVNELRVGIQVANYLILRSDPTFIRRVRLAGGFSSLSPSYISLMLSLSHMYMYVVFLSPLPISFVYRGLESTWLASTWIS